MANLNIITNQVISWVNESNLDFKLELGEKNLYIVIEWTDGSSLFIDDSFRHTSSWIYPYELVGNDSFLNELIATYCELDENSFEDKVYWFNKLFGIGSEWHGIADACDTESVDLNKMENEVNI